MERRLGINKGKTTIYPRGINYENVNWTEFVYYRGRLMLLLTFEFRGSGKFIDCVPINPFEEGRHANYILTGRTLSLLILRTKLNA